MDHPYTIKIFNPEPNSEAVEYDFRTHKNVVRVSLIFMSAGRC